MNPYTLNCKALASIRMVERRETEEYAEYKSKPVQLRPFKTEYEVAQSESIMCFDDGKPAVHKVSLGKGVVYLFGFSLGYGYHETASDIYEEIFRDVTAGINLTKQPYSDFKNGVYAEILSVGDDKELIFLFNVSGAEKTLPIGGTVLTYGGDFVVTEDGYHLNNNEMGYLVKQC